MDSTVEDATVSSPSLLLGSTQVPHEATNDVRQATEVEDSRAERRLKDAVRRYYALAELIDTERGYVDDLKILVEVYLTSLGAVTVPATRPRAESQPAQAPDVAESARFGSIRSSSYRLNSDPSSSRSYSYQYPPSSFPSSAAAFKEHVETKRKARVRPASMFFALQPQTMRLRKDSGPEPYTVRSLNKSGHETRMDTITSGSGSEFGPHLRTRSTGFGVGRSPANVRTELRRASVDVVQPREKPVCDRAFTSSPESSPRLSPLPSPSTPLSSQPASPLSTTSCTSQRQQRLVAALTDAEKQILARDAHKILTLHERIVKRLEHALGRAQGGVVERRRAMNGKGKSGNKQSEVECEVEAAVRAVCGIFISEASNFTPYDVFCAGHTEALEAARRIMRAHGSDWMEWEKRCNEVAAERDVGGIVSIDARVESPLPSPSSSKAITPSGSRNSLLSNIVLDVEDANSSTSTLRRRHSACASTSSLRASTSGSLKHTKSDPTPPGAGHGYGHVNGYDLANTYNCLSVKGLSRGHDTADSVGTPSGNKGEQERQRDRSRRAKLSFADYLIKPVQRLCKYPLLFEQLRISRKKGLTDSAPLASTTSLETGKVSVAVTASIAALDPDETPKKRKGHVAFHLGGDSEEDDEPDEADLSTDENATDAAIERVLRKMREVAKAVDEAQRRRDLEKKSALIVERLVAGAPGANHGAPVPIPMVDEKGRAEGAGLESRSELGHGIGSVSPGANAAWSTKPPARSLSFSSAFSRSRPYNSLGRTNSALLQYQQQQGHPSESGKNGRRFQVQGPPTRAFLTSLGACLLAGSLDVAVMNIESWPGSPSDRENGRRDSALSLAGISAMRSNSGLATASSYMPQASREPVKVKYLAAFLYVGGYIILAKTPKVGVYEPRHWFALTDETIEIVDVREDKALLPCSFHLVFHSAGHRLELAAACQREKEIWLDAMHHARSLPPTWEYEPVPTLNISANLMNANAGRGNLEVPPVPSVPAVGNDPLTRSSNPLRMASNSTLRTDATVKASRRQSVNGSGVRALFTNNSDNGLSVPPTVLIRRVSATRRAQTDRHLADVLSQPLLSARFHAKSRDEILFRDPDPPQQGSGISVGTMAKNKLMRESVLISKQYVPSICSSLESSAEQPSMISESASSITVQQHGQDSTRDKSIKKSRRGSLSMLLTLPGAISDASLRDSRTSTSSSQGASLSPNSPLPSTSTANSIDPFSQSQCSSASTSAPTPSPINELFPPEVRVVGVDSLVRTEGEELSVVLGDVDRPKRSRSLVDNFRGLFSTSRSSSSSRAPSVSSSRQASIEDSLEMADAGSTPQRNVFSKLLRGASFRSRGRTTSDLSDSAQPFSSSNTVAQTAPERPNLISRSSSVLALPQRKANFSAPTRVNIPDRTPAPSARLNSRSSRSSLTPGPHSQMSLGRSIKYRLFPGNLVPLTPIDTFRDRT